MGRNEIPTSREAVILGILTHGERYGREIRTLYAKEAGRSLPYGSLYVTLSRMEEQGFIASRQGESCHERGGNRRKYYRVTASGCRALTEFELFVSTAFRWGATHA
jgi:DNA-binding PadR family transcriptional regulator